MPPDRILPLAFTACAALAACSSTVHLPLQQPINATPQVVRLGVPNEAIGTQNDPTYGVVGGFTTQIYSQILGFSPGQQIVIMNAEGDGATQHTFGDTGSTSGFPMNTNLSTTSSNQSTISPGGNFQTGTINSQQTVGPITLMRGIYYIGCAYHYASNGMRDVLIVQPSATPGPQGTAPPGIATPAPGATPSY